jgi:hypothetical protein
MNHRLAIAAPKSHTKSHRDTPQRSCWQVDGARCPKCGDFIATDGRTTWCAGTWCCSWSDPDGQCPGGRAV